VLPNDDPACSHPVSGSGCRFGLFGVCSSRRFSREALAREVPKEPENAYAFTRGRRVCKSAPLGDEAEVVLTLSVHNDSQAPRGHGASRVDLDFNANLLCNGGPQVDRLVGRLD
jgi:hypothetical protein